MSLPNRIQDYWRVSRPVHVAATAPGVLAALESLYGRGPRPFQTLNFNWGTEQAVHSDSIHFNSEPFGLMCGVLAARVVHERALIRADVLDVLDYRCATWPASACDGLRSGLRELDQTATDLQLAMRTAPVNSQEARRLTARYLRTLEQARGLAGHAARL